MPIQRHEPEEIEQEFLRELCQLARAYSMQGLGSRPLIAITAHFLGRALTNDIVTTPESQKLSGDEWTEIIHKNIEAGQKTAMEELEEIVGSGLEVAGNA